MSRGFLGFRNDNAMSFTSNIADTQCSSKVLYAPTGFQIFHVIRAQLGLAVGGITSGRPPLSSNKCEGHGANRGVREMSIRPCCV